MLPSYRVGIGSSGNNLSNQLFDVDNFFNTTTLPSGLGCHPSTNFAGSTDPFTDFSLFRNSIPSAISTSSPSYPQNQSMFASATSSTPVNPLRLSSTSSKSPFPQQQDKYRLTMTLHGYSREDIKTFVENERLIVFARHHDQNGDDYQLREFKRHFFVPKNVDPTRMTTTLTRDNILIVEIPVILPATSVQSQSSSGQPNTEHSSFTASAAANTNNNHHHQPQLPPRLHRTRSNSAASTADYYNPSIPASTFPLLSSMTTTHQQIHSSESDLNRSGATVAGTVGGRTEPTKFPSTSSTNAPDSTQFDFEKFFSSPFNPSIVDDPQHTDQKKLEMKMNMQQYMPEQINLSLKHRELTLQVQECTNSNDYGDSHNNGASMMLQTYKIVLPPKVDLTLLKSRMEDGILYIEAPYFK